METNSGEMKKQLELLGQFHMSCNPLVSGDWKLPVGFLLVHVSNEHLTLWCVSAEQPNSKQPNLNKHHT